MRPDKQHDGGGEGEDDESVDGADLLCRNEGQNPSDDGATVTYGEAGVFSVRIMHSNFVDSRIVSQRRAEAIRRGVCHTES